MTETFRLESLEPALAREWLTTTQVRTPKLFRLFQDRAHVCFSLRRPIQGAPSNFIGFNNWAFSRSLIRPAFFAHTRAPRWIGARARSLCARLPFSVTTIWFLMSK